MRKQKGKKRRIPDEFYTFENGYFPFSFQTTRIVDEMRPNMFPAFSSGNHQFVYKNCTMISSDANDNSKMLNVLNDVLYSHSLFPCTGPEWEHLFSIISHESREYVCPICLFTPVAPRISQCGHIFCADCIKHQFSMDVDQKCAVCLGNINMSSFVRCDLKLDEPDGVVTFKKIMRSERNCLCFDCEDDDQSKFIPFASQISANFNRVLLADSRYIKRYLENEKLALEMQREIYSTNEYLDAAKVKMIDEVIEANATENIPESDGPKFMIDQYSKSFIYIYQEINGRYIFMKKKACMIISEAYGSMNNSPNELSVRILNRKIVKVDSEFCNKYPEYQHLPIGIDVEFIFPDLSEIVSGEILSKYKIATSTSNQDKKSEMANGPSTPQTAFHSIDYPILPNPSPKPKLDDMDSNFPSLFSVPKSMVTNVDSPWKSIRISGPKSEPGPSRTPPLSSSNDLLD